MKILHVRSKNRAELIDITMELQNEVQRFGMSQGLCIVYVPHTTAAVTINEGADAAVQSDILKELDKMVPWQDGYRHAEGNAAAHIKATLVGSSEMILIENGRLLLGTWQRVFFCEFDGPRNRTVYVKCTE